MNKRAQSHKRDRLHGLACRAFSLIEMIGVMAILAVLAATLIPAFIKRIDIATRNDEVATLAGFSNVLTFHAIRSNNIPDGATWISAVTNWSGLAPYSISTNSRRYSRIYFTEAASTPTLLTPQTAAGIGSGTVPQNLRAMVVSILGGDALDAVNCPSPGGGALSTSDFNALWNTTGGAKPTFGAWANWNGRGDDFLIQRLDYAPLFHRLVLNNRDANDAASYRINGSSYVSLARNLNSPGTNTFYYDGTVVGLCDGNGMYMTRYVLKRDISFVFEKGLWHAVIGGGTTVNPLAIAFDEQAKEFVKPAYLNPKSPPAAGSPSGVITTMYSFMLTYTYWANLCPTNFPYYGAPPSSPTQVPEYELLSGIGDNSAHLDVFSKDLLAK